MSKISKSKAMNARELYLRCALGEHAGRGVFWPDGLWGETAVRWKNEGMVPSSFGYDFSLSDSHHPMLPGYGYYPEFEQIVLEDLGDKSRVIDQYGVEKFIMKNNPGLQHFLKYPVEGRDDWEKLAPRLDADAPGRFKTGWAGKIKSSGVYGNIPLTLGGAHLCGFFSFLRETMGDNCYLMIYDDPDLVADMMKFQEERVCKIIRKTAAEVQIDRLFIWEDMCYKTGPLIGPEMFRELFLPHYCAVADTAKNCGIKVIDVDSDGNTMSLMPLWLEAGVNMFHPFEVQAGMDVALVRKKLGLNFGMWGGVDKRALTAGKTEIDTEMERIRPVYELGRYIPCVDHSVPPNVSFYNYCYYIDKLKKLLGL